MIYYNDLEDLVFTRHKETKADELVVLSGYVGPVPVMKLSDLPFGSQVIYGMYQSDGIKSGLHNILKEVTINSDTTKVLYAEMPIHSKCYIWRRNGLIESALIGSANFTTSGLTTPYKEILSDVETESYKPLNDYLNGILETSKLCTEFTDEQCIRLNMNPSFEYLNQKLRESVCNMPLYSVRENKVPEKSGLNWGLANAHVSEGDAYIGITTELINDYPSLFPPKQESSSIIIPGSRINRKNDPVELIWDDGTVMEGLLEGNLVVNGITYPNKLCSFPKKNLLGKYLRNRLGVDIDHLITLDDLKKYGRTSIGITLIGDGVYEMDFSPKQ